MLEQVTSSGHGVAFNPSSSKAQRCLPFLGSAFLFVGVIWRLRWGHDGYSSSGIVSGKENVHLS